MVWQERTDGTYCASVGGFQMEFEPRRSGLLVTATDYHADPQWVSIDELPGGSQARIVSQPRPVSPWTVAGMLGAALGGALLAWRACRTAQRHRWASLGHRQQMTETLGTIGIESANQHPFPGDAR